MPTNRTSVAILGDEFFVADILDFPCDNNLTPRVGFLPNS